MHVHADRRCQREGYRYGEEAEYPGAFLLNQRLAARLRAASFFVRQARTRLRTAPREGEEHACCDREHDGQHSADDGALQALASLAFAGWSRAPRPASTWRRQRLVRMQRHVDLAV